MNNIIYTYFFTLNCTKNNICLSLTKLIMRTVNIKDKRSNVDYDNLIISLVPL